MKGWRMDLTSQLDPGEGDDPIDRFFRELQMERRDDDRGIVHLTEGDAETLAELQQRIAAVTPEMVQRATAWERKHFSRREFERLVGPRRDIAQVQRYEHGTRTVLYLPDADGQYDLPYSNLGGEALDGFVSLLEYSRFHRAANSRRSTMAERNIDQIVRDELYKEDEYRRQNQTVPNQGDDEAWHLPD